MFDRISPNAITFSRIALIPVFVPLLLAREEYRFGSAIAFVVFALLSLTDGLDGYVARSRNKVTRLGIFLDPLADKLLVTAALVSLVQLDEISAWVVVLILSREFAVTGLRLIAAGEGVVIAAHWLGKLKTVAQIGLVLVLIIPDIPAGLGTVMTVITVLLTVGSGAEYFWKARRLLREAPHTIPVDGTTPTRSL
ncbi:MAG: CDP-diacylglycerol/glycerol-3-phosphate 3-phosphatidyltransferase [Thermoleophilia bacterium]|jgi:CDP-diacylglycerol--glycerol-3-phosphate 3-phosphatidyltransferase|nr:CDP-diacylglycerol/glycerol-3-phosphate 3-phosphatidyltransferase [Thermoleophilia bacterium]